MSDESVDRLLRRLAGVLAAEPEFLAAQPDSAVAASNIRPGIALAEALRIIRESSSDRPALRQREV